LTALADATNDLSMPCHEQRTGAATDWGPIVRLGELGHHLSTAPWHIALLMTTK